MQVRSYSTGLLVLFICAFAGVSKAAQTESLTQPVAGLTTNEALTAFGGAVLLCVETRMGNEAIANDSPDRILPVRPASTEDREWAGPRALGQTPVWITDKEGFTLNITEPSADRCEVRDYGLPVDGTFKAVVEAIQATLPDFKATSVPRGYNPIAYQLEAVRGDTRYILHLEGADDGTPGHALRGSLLYGYMLRQPASGPTPSSDQPAPEITRPTKNLTEEDLVATTAVAVDALCLGTRIKNQVIGDWSPGSRGGFHPAAAEVRALSGGRDSDIPVWASDKTGSLLTVTEGAPENCSVAAFYVPPEQTAQSVIAVATHLFPELNLKQIPVTSPLAPKAYQLEAVSDGTRYVMRLEGGQRDVPGSSVPLPYFMAFVVRQPASAPPPFR